MAKKLPTFLIGIPIYDGVDLLDVTAPCEMFGWLKNEVEKVMRVHVLVVSKTRGVVTTRDGLRLVPDQTFAKTPHLDLIWVPGGDLVPLKRTMSSTSYMTFLKSRSRAATYLTSVCEGALILASAGLLDGRRATTHWNFIPCLRRFKRVRVAPGYPRFVVDCVRDGPKTKRYVVTGGGISSGLDEALELIRRIAGIKVAENVQRVTQYFPSPPVSARIKAAISCPLDSISA